MNDRRKEQATTHRPWRKLERLVTKVEAQLGILQNTRRIEGSLAERVIDLEGQPEVPAVLPARSSTKQEEKERENEERREMIHGGLATLRGRGSGAGDSREDNLPFIQVKEAADDVVQAKGFTVVIEGPCKGSFPGAPIPEALVVRACPADGGKGRAKKK
jgi:hypothetical protein